ncbi:MAG: hypothetical protein R3F34_18850, partial [Planctomycetota bacterium]
AAAVAAALRLTWHPTPTGVEGAIAARFGVTQETLRSLFPPEATEYALHRLSQGLVLAAVAFAVVAVGAWFAAGRLRAFAPTLLLAVLFEIVATSRAHVLPRDLGGLPVFPASTAIEAVDRAASEGRVMRLADSVGEGMLLARPNMLQAYGIADVSAYVAFQPAATTEYFRRIDARIPVRGYVGALPDVALLDDERLDRAGVTCILSTGPVVHPRLSLEYDAPNFFVYRRSNPLPSSEWLDEPPAEDDSIGVRMRARMSAAIGRALSFVGVLVWTAWVTLMARAAMRRRRA